MSLNDRDTENFPPEPADSVLDDASSGLTQHMTKLHLNDIDTETLADETHTPQPMSTRSRSTLTQTMAGMTLNDSNQAFSTMTNGEILGHTGATQMISELPISGDHIITPAEQTSGVLSEVSESEGLLSTKRKDCGKGTREGLRAHRVYATHPLQTPNGKSWEQVLGRNYPSPEQIH